MGENHVGLNLFANQPPLPIHVVGRVFWVGNSSTPVPGGVTGVDSAGAYGDSPQRPFATIDYAVGQCTANRGDTIIVLPGHIESITAAAGLDLDVAGIRGIFLGEGSNRATIRFGTVVGADMDIDAADITLGVKGEDLGPRLLANIDALTGPIDVNSARFKMYGARWYDGTTINTTDCVVADANADNMEIEDIEFVDGDNGGTLKQSFIQVAGATGVVIRKVKCTGDFGTGIIENGTAWVDALLEDLVLDNANTTANIAIVLQATSSGWIKNSSLRVTSGSTYLTADNDMQFDNVKGTGTDATATEEVGTQLAGGLEAKVDVIDGYHDVPSADATTNTVIRDVVGAKDDTTTQTIAANVSLMRYVKGILNAVAGAAGLATYPSAAAPADAVNIAEVLAAAYYEVTGAGGLHASSVNTVSVNVDMSSATWNSVAVHEVFAVSGMVHARILPYVTTAFTAFGSGEFLFGTSGNTSAFIAATSANNFAADIIWLSTSGATNFAKTSVVDRLINAEDIGYEILTEGPTAGTLNFVAWWEPVISGSTLTAGAGGVMT